jgi:hypothetical protein
VWRHLNVVRLGGRGDLPRLDYAADPPHVEVELDRHGLAEGLVVGDVRRERAELDRREPEVDVVARALCGVVGVEL